MNLYTVFDVIADEAGPLFEAKNDRVAVRQYQNLLSQSRLDASEYKLYQVGVFNHDSMELSDLQTREIKYNTEVEDGKQGI